MGISAAGFHVLCQITEDPGGFNLSQRQVEEKAAFFFVTCWVSSPSNLRSKKERIIGREPKVLSRIAAALRIHMAYSIEASA
jgi:hypothetical protein